MPADRLTAETAKVGMRVVCVDASDNGHLREGKRYRISALHNGNVVLDDMPVYAYFLPRRFIPAAPPLPTMTEDWIEALRAMHRDWVGYVPVRDDSAIGKLLDLIERTPGLLPTPPRRTLTPREFQEMHNAG